LILSSMVPNCCFCSRNFSVIKSFRSSIESRHSAARFLLLLHISWYKEEVPIKMETLIGNKLLKRRSQTSFDISKLGRGEASTFDNWSIAFIVNAERLQIL
jgi:hypothetical protein